MDRRAVEVGIAASEMNALAIGGNEGETGDGCGAFKEKSASVRSSALRIGSFGVGVIPAGSPGGVTYLFSGAGTGALAGISGFWQLLQGPF